MKDNIRKLYTLFLLAFLCLIAQLTYWQIFVASSLQTNPANPRAWELEKDIWRGGIYDHYGEVLALSKFKENGEIKRVYPLGKATAHLLGYTDLRYGKAGLEASYNQELLGLSKKNVWQDFWTKLLGRKKRGNDLVLTLDSSLQQTAYQALAEKKGAIIVLKPTTGEILALVSKPSFLPAQLQNQWSSLQKSKDSQLLNRATNGLYPPGSTLKILIAGAALEAKKTKPEEIFHCPGYLNVQGKRINCFNHTAHGEIDLTKAMEVSCNVTFAQLGMRLGSNGLDEYEKKFNFSSDHSLGFSVAKSNLLGNQRLSEQEMAQRALGQGAVLTTPFYMLNLISAVANNGKLVEPYLVAEVRERNGHVLQKNHSPGEKEIFTPQTTNILVQMLEKVVEKGTGHQAGIKGITIAGKTGTAENPHGKSHSWFVGFAPAENPQIAIVVLVENGGTGGSVAAPLARRIFLDALEKK